MELQRKIHWVYVWIIRPTIWPFVQFFQLFITGSKLIKNFIIPIIISVVFSIYGWYSASKKEDERFAFVQTTLQEMAMVLKKGIPEPHKTSLHEKRKVLQSFLNTQINDESEIIMNTIFIFLISFFGSHLSILTITNAKSYYVVLKALDEYRGIIDHHRKIKEPFNSIHFKKHKYNERKERH